MDQTDISIFLLFLVHFLKFKLILNKILIVINNKLIGGYKELKELYISDLL